MPRVLTVVLLLSFAATASPARAQSAQSTMIGGCRVAELSSIEQQSDKVKNAEGVEENVSTALRSVRVDCDGMQFFAERMQVFHDRGRVVANGNVLFISGGHRISADRMDFDTKTRTGSFFDAHGVVSLGERVDRSLFGTQEADATFWGKEVQKLGPEKYRIIDGGFTTCGQPTPRWDVASGSVTLNLDDYALLVNAVFRVKGVPILYLPVFYYPIQEDDRATGFLIPTYGTSTVRGQTLSNAFFWALGRSHDATLLHDWFSKTGQGYGGEYRYELGGGSQGNTRVYVINEKETTLVDGTGQQVTQPAKKSYQVTGGLTQALGGGFRARANADYFSDITTQQRYQQNVYQATNSRRGFGGNITGNWAGYVLSGTLDRTDYFYPDDTVTTQGGLPRITVSRGEKPIRRSPLYFGANGEYVTFLRSTERNDVTASDQGLTRLDFNPTLRIPFTRWPFLTANSAVAWRGTYWTESKDPLTNLNVPEGIGRQYFDFSTRITGPVFHRIFDRPGGGYAEKFKHIVEPTLALQRTTAIDEFNRIVQLEGSDYAVGNVTRVSYGLNNRLYAKKGVSREILSLILGQTYYTDPAAAQFDHNYQSSFSGVRASKFSPMSVLVRTSPTDRIQGEFRTEYDFFVDAFRTYAATGSVNGSNVQVSGGWSRRRFIPNLQGFNDPNLANHYLNAAASVRRARNRVGAQYAFNYDLRQDTFLQQRFMAYYNAQCCGISVEYQNFNFNNGFAGVQVSEDRRFNISFTLAGIGSFSNALGAFGGQQGR